MDSPRPVVSVVIPNHNGVTSRRGLSYLEMVLPSLSAQTFRDFDVTVVDDASTDGSVAYLEQSWPQVRVVALDENVGFAAVINRGIEASTGEHVALVNNDVELSPDWLEELVGELRRDSRLGFVTGKILSYETRDVIDEVGQDYYSCGRFSPRGKGERDAGQYEQRQAIPIATAAASIYRRAAIESAGGFDEDYVFYCEDADLCLRMLLSGYRGSYVPGSCAYHVGGGTLGGGSELARFRGLRNGLLTVFKDLPGPTLFRSLVKIAVYEWHQLKASRESRIGRVWLRSCGSFLRMLPGTLRKRRRIQRGRAISAAEFEELVRTDYPLPTHWGRLVGLRWPTG